MGEGAMVPQDSQGGKSRAPKKAKVFVVADHPIVRHGLVHLIDMQEDLRACGEAESAADALPAIGKLNPDAVIADISLKGAIGIQLVKDIRAHRPELLVLVISMHDESLYAERALRAGAKGYIMREEGTETVLAAIRGVLAGRIWVSNAIAGRLLRRLANGGKAGLRGPIESLSDRELQVFELTGRGLPTRQVAAELKLGVKTVESHRAHIKRKLGLKNAAELVQHAVQWVEIGQVG
jgi:DNA-binding NarL/FixJ family response regulator